MQHILVVEDEPRIASFITKGLTKAGYKTSVASTVAQGRQMAVTAEIDLIILDLGLPDGDGYQVLSYVRAAGLETPVIILTARNTPADTVTGLTSGADDYMPKPFNFEELLARMSLRLRPLAEGPTEDEVLRHGPITMDLAGQLVTVDGQQVELSVREFQLAEMFLRHPDQALSRDQLVDAVWGQDVESNVVDVYVRYLRNKMGAEFFQTVRGVGYRLAPVAGNR